MSIFRYLMCSLSLIFLLNCSKNEPEIKKEAKILSFKINNVDFNIINQTEIKGSLPYGADITKLIATFVVSQGAEVRVNNKIQKSGVTINDFTNTLRYEVISEDKKNKEYYEVKVEVEKNNQANILGFTINSVVFTIDQSKKSIKGILPYKTDLSKLIVNFTVSNGAQLKVNNAIQKSGVTVNDFRTPLTYTVISENGKIQKDYLVTAEAKNDKADILSFKIDNVDFDIDKNTKKISKRLYGLDITKLIASFTVSSGATVKVDGNIQTSGVTVNDFTNIVNYIVTSEDGKVTNTYKVEVTIKNEYSTMKEFKFLKSKNSNNLYADIVGNIDHNRSEITVNIDGVGNNNFIADFKVSAGATVKANNIPVQSGVTKINFNNVVNYSVKSQDGQQSKIYKVKVNYKNQFSYIMDKQLAIGGPLDVLPETVFGGAAGVKFKDITTPNMPGVSLDNNTGRVAGTVSVELCAFTYGIKVSLAGRYMKCLFKTIVYNLVGSGTSSDPYLIFTPKHLNEVRFHMKRNFKLMNDIDMSSDDKYINNFLSIGHNNGRYGNRYMGTFDGNGFKIVNLKINTNADYVGLFRLIADNGKIKNLGIEKASITTTNLEGTGVISGAVGGVIEGCYVKNSNIDANKRSGLYYNYRVGGIAGYIIGGAAVIKNSYVEDVIIDSEGKYVGKLVGEINKYAKVESCYSKGGQVSGLGFGVGGLVGNLWGGKIINSYSIGGKVYVVYKGYGGGIVGFGSDNFSMNEVIKSYSTDEVYHKKGISYEKNKCCGIGGTDVGVYKDNSIVFYKVNSSFWNTDIHADGGPSWSSSYYTTNWKNHLILIGKDINTGNGKAMGKSTADMKKKSTYTTYISDPNKRWNFNSVWKIDASKNNGYPYLRWQDN